MDSEELRLIDAYWRAANYLSVGQIYLQANPLLREPLRLEHVKRRLLGHWGTTPGLNLLYVHMNRAIRQRDLDAIYVTGPGHGGPGLVANAYLEGTYSRGLRPHRRGRGGDAATVPPVLLPRRDPIARRAGDARVDPRGGRTRLLTLYTPMARCSTTRSCLRCASSATARPRRDRSRRAGTRTSSSIPRATEPCCRSCT